MSIPIYGLRNLPYNPKKIKKNRNNFQSQSINRYKKRYLTSAGIVYNNMLIRGTNYGTIKIIDINSGIEKEIKLPYNSSVISFAIFKDIIFAGLENGYILKLENR